MQKQHVCTPRTLILPFEVGKVWCFDMLLTLLQRTLVAAEAQQYLSILTPRLYMHQLDVGSLWALRLDIRRDNQVGTVERWALH